jgi:hypothetical protein
MPILIIPGSPHDARCGAVHAAGEGPRGGGQGNGGNFAGMGGGYGAGSGGEEDGSGSWGSYYSTHDITGFGTNGIGGPDARSSGDTLNSGLHASPGASYGSSGGSSPMSISSLLGAMFGHWGQDTSPMSSIPNNPNLTIGQIHSADADAVKALGGWLGGTNQAARAYQSGLGYSPDTSALGAFGGDFTGWNNPGGLLGSPLGTIGKGIGLTAASMVNPALAMGLGGMMGLASGQNPGGVFGGMGASMLSPLLGSALGALGPAGQIVGPLAQQAMNWGGRKLGASAYNAGYGAPASQGPQMQGGGVLGGDTGTPAAPMQAAPTQFAGVSAPAVTAPVSNPVANPLRALLLALGPRAGINVPLLLGGQPQQPQQRPENSVT